ncbi:MAG: hypothetical protein ACRD1H_10785, partial [Vicinamibacterales bacterium]
MKCHLAIATAAVLTCTAAEARQPSITNGRIETRVVTAPLDREMRALSTNQTEPLWIGYAVPARSGDHRMCCWNGDGSRECCAGCRLEPGAATAVTLSHPPQGA